MFPVPAASGVLDGALWVGVDEFVAAYVASRVPHMDARHGFGPRDPITGRLPYVALGVCVRDRFAGGVVLHSSHSVNGKKINIEMSAAFEPGSGWATKATLRQLFAYPFVQNDYVRLTTITARSNKVARKGNVALGFKLEGVARKSIDGREDAMIYGMLREDCRFI